MFGNKPARPPELSDGNKLNIQEIFHTIQGEGVYVGYSSIFIRLGGCNLQCKFCDTEFESFKERNLSEIISEVKEKIAGSNCKLAVITGGEPFRQNIEKLCDELISIGLKVQIESNGTLYRKIHNEVEVICSPKITRGKYHPIREDLKKHIIAYKFLLSNYHEGYNQIPEWDFGGKKVYLQSIDECSEEKNKENLKLTIETVHKTGYILCLQTHKFIGIE